MLLVGAIGLAAAGCGGEEEKIPLNIVGYFANAKMVNALFERLNPALAARVIHIGEGSVDPDAVGEPEPAGAR